MLPVLQRLLLDALLADDPPATLRESLATADLNADVRQMLAGIDETGLRLASLLIGRLRFERLTGADAALASAFRTDPAEFVRQFAAYHRDVPPTAYFPAEETEAFRRWLR